MFWTTVGLEVNLPTGLTVNYRRIKVTTEIPSVLYFQQWELKKKDLKVVNLCGSYQEKPHVTPPSCTKHWQPTLHFLPWQISDIRITARPSRLCLQHNTFSLFPYFFASLPYLSFFLSFFFISPIFWINTSYFFIWLQLFPHFFRFFFLSFFFPLIIVFFCYRASICFYNVVFPKRIFFFQNNFFVSE